MNFQFANNLITSYKRLSYKAWYALAEFVDNSTQAYFNNRDILDAQFKKENTSLKVKIEYSHSENKIVIWDNSIGMSYDELKNALTLGRVPDNNTGRSKYGLGMKTAACWFGNHWTIETKKLGEEKAIKVTIDVDRVAEGDDQLPEESFDKNADDHYTEIVITKLNSQLRTTTLSKIKDFLQSMYRIDFTNYGLQLYWQGDPLVWDNLKNYLYITEDGKPFLKNLRFTIGNKIVTGWVGVLAKGKASRKNSGFSIIQADRVIEGWPKGYKPVTIFGDQEGGINDLVNQRLTGELILDGFAVSHTKDAILWEGSELDEIEEKLFELCEEAIYLAKNVRFNKPGEQPTKELDGFKNEAMELFEGELSNNAINDYIVSVAPPPEEIIEKSYNRIEERIIAEEEIALTATIGYKTQMITVNIFFSKNSEFEPYALIELNTHKDNLNVIINTIHPYFRDFGNSETILNFIRHCVYDGVSEWKALKLIGEIKPNTVKFIKDGLLRLPFEIANTSK